MFIRLMIVIMFVATACTPNAVEEFATPQEILENPTESSLETIATPSPVVDEGLQKKFIQIATNDLATRLNVDAESISLVSAEAAVWMNAALGCPLVDQVYRPKKVAGFRIRLKSGEEVYDYHTDRTGQVLLCPDVEPDEPGLR